MKNLIALNLPGGTNIDPVAGMPGGGTSAVSNLIQNIMTDLLVIASLIALAFLIFGGVKWITSGGEKEKIEEARKMIIYALIGLSVAFAAFFIVNTIGKIFGVHLLSTL